MEYHTTESRELGAVEEAGCKISSGAPTVSQTKGQISSDQSIVLKHYSERTLSIFRMQKTSDCDLTTQMNAINQTTANSTSREANMNENL